GEPLRGVPWPGLPLGQREVHGLQLVGGPRGYLPPPARRGLRRRRLESGRALRPGVRRGPPVRLPPGPCPPAAADLAGPRGTVGRADDRARLPRDGRP